MLKKLIAARHHCFTLVVLAILCPVMLGCGGTTAEEEKTPEQQLEEDKSRQQRELQETRGG